METMKKEKSMEEEVVIVGGGIAGLATAVAMKRIGIRALVLERSECLRTTGAALTLFPNAWLALDALGVSYKLTSVYAPISKQYVTNIATGAIQEVALSGNKGAQKLHGPRAVHRRALLEALAEELPADSIRFSSKLVSIEKQDKGDDSIVIVRLEDGTTVKSKMLIGCDGVHSVVARWLGLSTPVDSGRSAVRGLSVYPQGHGFKEVRQYVDAGKRAGFSPLNNTEVYWGFVCQTPPKGEALAREPKLIQREVLEKYAKNFPSTYLDVVQHAEVSSLTWAPLMLRYPWDVIFGTLNKGNVTVAGDAMHPMTPDLGQGGCSALEDAVVLGRHIGNSLIKNGGRLVPKDVVQALDGYVKERRLRAAALITLSYISGRVQQGGERWWMKYLRDSIFYKYAFARLVAFVHHDCGKLPVVNSELDQLNARE